MRMQTNGSKRERVFVHERTGERGKDLTKRGVKKESHRGATPTHVARALTWPCQHAEKRLDARKVPALPAHTARHGLPAWLPTGSVTRAPTGPWRACVPFTAGRPKVHRLTAGPLSAGLELSRVSCAFARVHSCVCVVCGVQAQCAPCGENGGNRQTVGAGQGASERGTCEDTNTTHTYGYTRDVEEEGERDGKVG
jgi:hypothetical protein